MKIAVYGGSFNPPHLGHLDAASCVYENVKPDKMLIIPANIPPHKQLPEGSPSGAQRMELCRANFAPLERAEISDIELNREGRSYTYQTIEELRTDFPEAEIFLVVGTDMLLSFETWREYEYLLRECTLTALTRDDGDDAALIEKKAELERKYGACVLLIPHKPLPMSSGEIRKELKEGKGRDKLSDDVYSLIVQNGLYGVKADLSWLREKSYSMLDERRVPHVRGCEEEAVRLAKRWGADAEKAAAAGILHDCTKKLSFDKQLILCEKYGIILDISERQSPQLLHAKTGAAVAKAVFGMPEDICRAICRHTTGKPQMSLLEKIIYLADYIEPTRSFPGVDTLRELAYSDLDMALMRGLEMSVEDIRARGDEPYVDTLDALEYARAEIKRRK